MTTPAEEGRLLAEWVRTLPDPDLTCPECGDFNCYLIYDWGYGHAAKRHCRTCGYCWTGVGLSFEIDVPEETE